jgi:hypothetical protein
MEFENLRNLDTQNEKLVRKIRGWWRISSASTPGGGFRQQFARCTYVVDAGGRGVYIFCLLVEESHIEKIARDFPMSVWDYAASAGARLTDGHCGDHIPGTKSTNERRTYLLRRCGKNWIGAGADRLRAEYV